MERMGHSQLLTAQRYLHTLPDADEQALAAFERIRSRHRSKPEEPIAGEATDPEPGEIEVTETEPATPEQTPLATQPAGVDLERQPDGFSNVRVERRAG